jgi:hypothetical protein
VEGSWYPLQPCTTYPSPLSISSVRLVKAACLAVRPIPQEYSVRNVRLRLLTSPGRTTIVQQMRFDLQRYVCSTLVLGALALGLISCGGGTGDRANDAPAHASGDTKSTSAQSPRSVLSTTQLIAHGDAICRRLNAELAKAKAIDTQEILRVVPRNVSLERKSLEELSHLVPPASITTDWKRILGYRRSLANELVALLRRARQHDAAAVAALTASKKREHAALRETATRHGFKDCAELG